MNSSDPKYFIAFGIMIIIFLSFISGMGFERNFGSSPPIQENYILENEIIDVPLETWNHYLSDIHIYSNYSFVFQQENIFNISVITIDGKLIVDEIKLNESAESLEEYCSLLWEGSGFCLEGNLRREIQFEFIDHGFVFNASAAYDWTSIKEDSPQKIGNSYYFYEVESSEIHQFDFSEVGLLLAYSMWGEWGSFEMKLFAYSEVIDL